MKLDEKTLLTRKEASLILGVKSSTLASWKCRKTHPLKFVKIGRLIKYQYGDLCDFIEKNKNEGCNMKFFK